MRLAFLLLFAGMMARAEGDSTFQNVVVKPGDTLWSISNKYLKDPARWDQILKHNKLPTADPTVALPGMTLKVPIALIKSNLRAAHLVYAINRVLQRRKDTADWKGAQMSMELFQGDSLRTLDESKARVKFLNKDLLSLEANSMAIIKPSDQDADIELRSGSVFAGPARVVTRSAMVTPRTADTRFAASIEADLTTRVEVYKGAAGVDAQGGHVEVAAGMQTRIAPGLAPEIPTAIVNMPELEARAQEFNSSASVGGGAAPNPRAALAPAVPEADAESLRGDIQSLHVGVPILGYHVQAARDHDFKQIVFDRKYEADERFSPADAGLSAGAYWWRSAIVDLLGTEQRFAEPRFYSVGVRRSEKSANVDLARALRLLSPEDGAYPSGDSVNVAGLLTDQSLRLEVNGRPARIDADGNFAMTVKLGENDKEIVLVVSDAKGNSSRISRRISRR